MQDKPTPQPWTGKDLILLGLLPGKNFPKMIQRANELIEEDPDTTPESIKETLLTEFPPIIPTELRKTPKLHTEAIHANNPEEEQNLLQVRKKMNELLLVPVVEAGALMPDACPAGSAPAVIPVGGAIAVRNAIIPGAHSADICCSMYATFYKSDAPVAGELDALTKVTRFGAGKRKASEKIHHPVLDEDVWNNPFLKGLEDLAIHHMADQGDGNHFAYIGETEMSEKTLQRLSDAGYKQLVQNLVPGQTYRVLVTHHGSRGLGAKLYKRGQEAALRHCAKTARNIPASAVWLDSKSEEGIQYWDALQYIARWTKANHQSIHSRFLTKLRKTEECSLGNEHNFVWKKDGEFQGYEKEDEIFYHGKGATPAWRDKEGRFLLGLIPLNMAEPILLVLGKDNKEFLSFAPHGAGRNLSRTALKNKIGDAAAQEETIRETTKAIDVRWYSGKADVSETPMAYKNAATVRAQIEQYGLAETITEIRPLGCIMAGEAETPDWKLRKEKKKKIEEDKSLGKKPCAACEGKGYTRSIPKKLFGKPKVMKTECAWCGGNGLRQGTGH